MRKKLVLLISLVAGVFLANSTFADNVDYTVNVADSLNVTVSSNNVVLNLNPNTKTSDSQDITVTVGTNNITGYKLNMSSTGDITSLTRDSSVDGIIASIPTLSSAAGTTASSLSDNTWGYRLNNTGNFIPYVSGVQIMDNSAATNEDTATLSFASKIDYTKSAGTYAIGLSFTATAIPACTTTVGTTYDFDYTGSEETFTIPCDGYYQLEVWGASGSSTTTNYGYGGYATGIYNGELSDQINIVVGQQTGNVSGGYNGGGKGGGVCYGGGGATHIALDPGLLSSLSEHATDGRILIVAGGGGGSWNYSGQRGGNGGGISGGNASGNGWGVGGTQTAGGSTGVCVGSTSVSCTDGSFGQGGNVYSTNVSGGGGGYYGGSVGWRGGALSGSGGGGSGYINSSNLISSNEITKHMTCYSCTTSAAAETYTISNTNVSATPTADYSKTGNGYARITYLGIDI